MGPKSYGSLGTADISVPCKAIASTRRTDRSRSRSSRSDPIDHDLHNLDPNLPSRYVVQDLYRTDRSRSR